ncbi:MAG TPA: hypothetical protein VFS55_11185 [Dokdonella sp.]|nr:hypothetical protein [Dokdonella sp.]
MRSLCNGWLFMHGHVVDIDLARRLAHAATRSPAPAPRRAGRAPLRRLAALLGWLGCGAVRAWPH